jgi:hypothetical protein
VVEVDGVDATARRLLRHQELGALGGEEHGAVVAGVPAEVVGPATRWVAVVAVLGFVATLVGVSVSGVTTSVVDDATLSVDDATPVSVVDVTLVSLDDVSALSTLGQHCLHPAHLAFDSTEPSS